MNSSRAAVLFFLMSASLFGCGGGTDETPSTQAVQPPPKVITYIPTVFIGDSITNFWPLDSYPALIKKGIGGQTSQQMLARFQTDVIALAPAQVHILAGTNDIIQQQSTDISAVATMAAQAVAAGIVPILATIPPINPLFDVTQPIPALVNTWNENVKALAAAHGYKLVDYHSAMVLGAGAQNVILFMDYVHPNATGYGVMFSLVLPFITTES